MLITDVFRGERRAFDGGYGFRCVLGGRGDVGSRREKMSSMPKAWYGTAWDDGEPLADGISRHCM